MMALSYCIIMQIMHFILFIKYQIALHQQIEGRMTMQYKSYFITPRPKSKTNQNQININNQQNPVYRRMSENLQSLINHEQKAPEIRREYDHSSYFKKISPRPNNNLVSRERSLTPTMTNVSEIEDRYKKIQLILNDQNGNLKAQNQYIKAEVKRLYEREKKHKAVIKKYKLTIEELKLQNQIYQDRYEQLKIYVGEVILRLSELQQNESNEKILQYSTQTVQNLKREFSLQNQNLQNMLTDGKKNCSSSKITSDIQETKNDQQETLGGYLNIARNNSNKSNNSTSSNHFQSEKYTHATQYRNILGKEDIPFSYNCQTQNVLEIRRNVKKNFQKQEEGKKNNIQQTLNYSHEFLCTEYQYSMKIQQLSDQFQALMYEYKKSNNKDKQIRKRAIQISQQIKKLKGFKEKIIIQKKPNRI